ncbi:MAG: HesA/MoeB/ThiF family protein [Rhodanobacter sp.]|nr:MAG: HesA/MoeB/ThiF family protein [Rhodanobacter sp.]TAM08439.1 MAG: HesA/MoeB/ThiF family protein [Rhodanobacter sp.]TAM36567.1 MAG: HesA/MoeB/ThiF family protein [Rhodanobacter sp.]
MNEIRYARQTALPGIGPAGQARLGAAAVLVVGAGGIGCPALACLVGAGVGHLLIVDPDRVSLANLHRQYLYAPGDVGQPKVQVARAALHRFNPEARISAIASTLTPTNAPGLVAQATLVLDASDNRAVTYMLDEAASHCGKPLVAAAALGFDGYVGCYGADAPDYRTIFPDMPHAAGNCTRNGVLGSVTGVIGHLAAHLALRWLLGMHPSPAGDLLRFDGCHGTTTRTDFRTAPPATAPPLRFIAREAVQPEDCVIDLRSVDEAPAPAFPHARRLLPAALPAALSAPTGARIVLCCRSGLRAWHAGRRLQHAGFPHVALLALGP